jgi:peroxiredoxin
MTTYRLAALLVLAALAGGSLSGCGAGDASAAAPDFTLSSPDGRSTKLSSMKGKVVVLNFWATWCDSCKEELPVLQELQTRSAAGHFDLLAVSVDDDPAKVVPPFAAAHRIGFPLLYADRHTMDAYAVRMLPTTFLIAPDGTIARRYVGPLDAQAIENDILQLLNRRPS